MANSLGASGDIANKVMVPVPNFPIGPGLTRLIEIKKFDWMMTWMPPRSTCYFFITSSPLETADMTNLSNMQAVSTDVGVTWQTFMPATWQRLADCLSILRRLDVVAQWVHHSPEQYSNVVEQMPILSASGQFSLEDSNGVGYPYGGDALYFYALYDFVTGGVLPGASDQPSSSTGTPAYPFAAPFVAAPGIGFDIRMTYKEITVSTMMATDLQISRGNPTLRNRIGDVVQDERMLVDEQTISDAIPQAKDPDQAWPQHEDIERIYPV